MRDAWDVIQWGGIIGLPTDTALFAMAAIFVLATLCIRV